MSIDDALASDLGDAHRFATRPDQHYPAMLRIQLRLMLRAALGGLDLEPHRAELQRLAEAWERAS